MTVPEVHAMRDALREQYRRHRGRWSYDVWSALDHELFRMIGSTNEMEQLTNYTDQLKAFLDLVNTALGGEARGLNPRFKEIYNDNPDDAVPGSGVRPSLRS